MLLVAIYSRNYSLQDNEIVPFRDEKSERLRYFTGPNVFSGLSVFLFAYIGEHGSFEIYRSLKRPSFSSWKGIANYAVLTAFILSAFYSATCWLNLGDAIEDNIMDTFLPTDVTINVCKVVLAIVMCLTYPMDFFVARQNINQGFFVDWLGRTEYMPLVRFLLISFFIWAAAGIIGKSTAVHSIPIATTSLISVFLLFFAAISFSNLEIVMGLGGAIGGSSVGFTAPSLIYLKTFRPEIMDAYKKSKLKGLSWVAMPVACLLFGVMALVAGTVSAILLSI